MPGLIAVLTLAAQLLPELEDLVPLVDKAVRGEDFGDTELEQLEAVRQALDAKVAAAVADDES